MKTNKMFVWVMLFAILFSLTACTQTPKVSNFFLATDEQGLNKTTLFLQTDAFNLFFDVSNVPSGTLFETKWYILNVSSQDPNTPFQTMDQKYDGSSSALHFHLTNSGNWPVAQYRVDIFMSGNQVGELQFNVSQ
jgi:hypothetical protein